jgi:DNA-binding GntR family transcriptional regulator
VGEAIQSGIVRPASPYRPLNQDAYEALRDAIRGGLLTPGQRIVEAEIARQMEISRAPVREAIRKLEQDGLVQYLPRRGVVVSTLSPEDVSDVYLMRIHLEAYAAKLATSRLTDEELVKLAQHVDGMYECASRNDLIGMITEDVEFHTLICRASGSKRLYQLWDSLHPQNWTLLSSLKASELTLVEIADRHRAVLAALESREPDRAEAAVRDHITEFAERVLRHLESEANTARRRNA